MARVGDIKGRIVLQIGSQELVLGDIAIPLIAMKKPREHSGAPEITLGIHADLTEVRKTVEAIFRPKD